MRSVILRSLAVIGLGGLLLAGVLYVASTVDARPPQVVEIQLTQPVADDPRQALITTSLEVVFSEPVEAASAADALSVEPVVDGAVSWSGSTMIFTPSDPLELETDYRVEIAAGIRDLAGNEIAELPPAFEFRTVGRPTLVQASPADGASDVPLDDPIALTFSRLMDTASVEAELRVLPAFPHDLRWSGELLEIVPTVPLRPGQRYEVSIRAGAADVAGVALAEAISISFRTAAPGLAVETLVPADGIDGIAPTSPIAVIFDRPIDPGSVSDDLLAITPEVAGTLEVVPLPGEAGDDGAGSVLRFTPSGPLAPNTTFEVSLATGPTSTTGGGLAAPAEWTFTTGAPAAAISNQITFLSDRGGVANVWAMNPDGTAKRQLSAELTPVLDYAVAPDGSSLVVADGRRLVYQRADGSDRRVLTDDGAVEFDPTYSPDGQRIAFARADAESGDGLGLWEWQVGAGDPSPIALSSGSEESPRPSGSAPDGADDVRAPRYSPDGGALAFVDLAGAVGVLELEEGSLTLSPLDAASPPLWLPDSSGVLVNGSVADGDAAARLDVPVTPLRPGLGDVAFRLSRGGAEP
ncbi:MAG: Ig-like domain-containing protein, partial [Chloroflexota bacterium]|nr:Ig-like domain-containing protein [Chloroflexota bacterium]